MDGEGWYVFNDFLVKAVSEEEALSFPGTWKVRFHQCCTLLFLELHVAYASPTPDPLGPLLPSSRVEAITGLLRPALRDRHHHPLSRHMHLKVPTSIVVISQGGRADHSDADLGTPLL